MERNGDATLPLLQHLGWTQPWTRRQWSQYVDASGLRVVYGTKRDDTAPAHCTLVAQIDDDRTSCDNDRSLMPLWFWDGGVLAGERIIRSDVSPFPARTAVLLSSRLGCGLERSPAWRRAMAAALNRVQASRQPILTAEGMTSDAALRALASRCGLRLARVHLPIIGGDRTERPFGEWFHEQWNNSLSGIRSTSFSGQAEEAWISLDISPRCAPSLRPAAAASQPSANGRQPLILSRQTEQANVAVTESYRLPLADRLLLALADDVFVLYVRTGHGIARLISHGLRLGAFQHKRLYVNDDPACVAHELTRSWTRRGATSWSILSRRRQLASETQRDDGWKRWTRSQSRSECLPRAACDVDQDQYLFHWTRLRSGPWPHQTEEEYYAEWILQPHRRPPTALDPLRRILATNRLIASSQLIRGRHAVVCFTSRRLSEFPRLRRYRRHLARWDFEPYGIAVLQNRLMELGAQPVQYGDEATWRSLPPEQRPFFQTRQGQSAESNWCEESEWRVNGDVDLSCLDSGDAFVFVATEKEARSFALESWLPVVWLENA